MQLFTCIYCPRLQPRNDMVQPKKRKPYICLKCRRKKSKNQYKNNKQIYAARAPRRRAASRAFIQKLKSESCSDCGQKFHYCQMDFDHRDPTQKKLPISRMSLMGLESIKKEIAKCDLVCANCHRDRTQRQVTKSPQPQSPSYEYRKRKEIEDFVNQLKNGKLCADCKQPHPYWRLDFDHSDGSGKKSTISRMKLSKLSRERIIEEIAKCDLVCVRCHRLRTHTKQSQNVNLSVDI